MTSYQRRLQDIKFLTERGEDLEAICMALAHELNKHQIPIPLVMGAIDGDRFINDIPDFQLRLASA